MVVKEDRPTARQQAEALARMLREAAREAQLDVHRVDGPKAQALFETVRDVLNGTIKALDDYAREREVAWQ